MQRKKRCQNKIRRTTGKKAFTLLELLIAISLVGILAVGSIIIVNPKTQIERARDAERKEELRQIQNALETYYHDNGKYPEGTSINNYTIGNVPWNTQWLSYSTVLPKDPVSDKKYVYYSDEKSYYLYASLDRGGNDPQACFPNGDPCKSAKSLLGSDDAETACGGNCNYVVKSPNAKAERDFGPW